ncbi:hypothetical protein EON81_04810 [bacterium]|nr:MAG: hypothetical protein EON81_04810 [bacterium]
MKITYLSLLPLALLVGCSSKSDDSGVPSSSNAGLTAEQKVEKIQSDPNIPDGLKQIKADTIQRQEKAAH